MGFGSFIKSGLAYAKESRATGAFQNFLARPYGHAAIGAATGAAWGAFDGAGDSGWGGIAGGALAGGLAGAGMGLGRKKIMGSVGKRLRSNASFNEQVLNIGRELGYGGKKLKAFQRLTTLRSNRNGYYINGALAIGAASHIGSSVLSTNEGYK